ncbi:hypothetical protein MWU59_11720 [Flavobacteriaceae bacterium F08102]|nr:hypothetical protein [Flavobacteriaceae bacterium F08102]
MKIDVKIVVQMAAIFIWIGFVGAISFMEAWLKFQAPGITIPLGLGIGRLVFNALSTVEWVLFIVVLACRIRQSLPILKSTTRLIFGLFAILLLQRIWLLPALDIRAEQLIQGNTLEPSNLHVYYVFLEVIKLTLLSWLGGLFTRKLKEQANRIMLNYKPI